MSKTGLSYSPPGYTYGDGILKQCEGALERKTDSIPIRPRSGKRYEIGSLEYCRRSLEFPFSLPYTAVQEHTHALLFSASEEFFLPFVATHEGHLCDGKSIDNTGPAWVSVTNTSAYQKSQTAHSHTQSSRCIFCAGRAFSCRCLQEMLPSPWPTHKHIHTRKYTLNHATPMLRVNARKQPKKPLKRPVFFIVLVLQPTWTASQTVPS